MSEDCGKLATRKETDLQVTSIDADGRYLAEGYIIDVVDFDGFDGYEKHNRILFSWEQNNAINEEGH